MIIFLKYFEDKFEENSVYYFINGFYRLNWYLNQLKGKHAVFN